MRIVDVAGAAELIPHVVWVAGPDGTTHFLNQRGLDVTGTSADLADWAWERSVHPDDAADVERAWGEAGVRLSEFEVEHRIRVVDGSYRWVICRGRPVIEDGSVVGWIGTWTDVDDARRLREELLATQQETSELLALTRVIEATAPVATAFVTADLRVVRMNQTMAGLHGLAADQLTGRIVADLVPGAWPDFEPHYRHVVERRESTVHLHDIPDQATGRPASSWLATYYPVVRDGELIGVGVVGVDITEVKEAEAFRAVLLDTMDEGMYAIDREGRVTLANRAAERLLGWTEAELLGRNAHDLVHFQNADGTPMPVADCPLLGVRATARPVRMSSDVFTHKDGTMIPVAYSAAPLLDGSGVRGAVVIFRDASDEHRQLDQVRKELDALAWLGRIRDALDEGRLVAYAQPIVHLDGARDSEELLVRMITPAGDVVLPAVFLPIAERYGLIGDIDRFMIREAARRAATGRQVEVNLSVWTISNLDVLPIIERELREAGANPANLVIEITETALMRNVDRGLALAQGLSSLGCGIALDDFGTGFGSFTYLKQLPIDVLKIDIEFVRDLPNVTANQHLVRATVSLAQAFGLTTIAEGVEDQATLELLRSFGVDAVQGFHLGAPAPIHRDRRAHTGRATARRGVAAS